MNDIVRSEPASGAKNFVRSEPASAANNIVESTAPLTEPGPDDLRWAEEMFEEWQRLLADVRPAVAAAHPAGSAGEARHAE